MSSVTPQLELPVLAVDQEHWQTAGVDKEMLKEYQITCHEGFILSTAGYQFTIPEEVGFSSPNIIQFVLGKEQLYAMAYEPGITEYVVKAGNLASLYGSTPFNGFTSGQKVIVAIGHLSPATKTNPQPKFMVLWVGLVNIA